MFRTLVFPLAIIFFSGHAFAACGVRQYTCVSAIFEKETRELNLEEYGKSRCQGKIHYHGAALNAVVDQSSCPQPGTKLQGHLSDLCQDTGNWTKADYLFITDAGFCSKTPEDALADSKKLVSAIKVGMSRKQVHDIMKNAKLLTGRWKWDAFYVHPNVIVEVPIDPNGKDYMDDNKVNGSAVVKTIGPTVTPELDVVTTVVASKSKIQGGVDPDEALGLVSLHIAQFEYCHARKSQRDPWPDGDVSIQFTADKMGQVKKTSVQRSTLKNAEIEKCVADQFQKIRFPVQNQKQIKGTFFLHFQNNLQPIKVIE